MLTQMLVGGIPCIHFYLSGHITCGQLTTNVYNLYNYMTPTLEQVRCNSTAIVSKRKSPAVITIGVIHARDCVWYIYIMVFWGFFSSFFCVFDVYCPLIVFPSIDNCVIYYYRLMYTKTSPTGTRYCILHCWVGNKYTYWWLKKWLYMLDWLSPMEPRRTRRMPIINHSALILTFIRN